MEEAAEYRKMQAEIYEKMMKVEAIRAIDFFNSPMASFAIVQIDGGIIKAVNQRFLDETGYEFPEIIGESWLKFIWPEDAERTTDRVDKMRVDKRGIVNLINRWRKKNGEPVIFQWRTNVDEKNGLYFCIVDVLTPCPEKPAELCPCRIERGEECWRQHEF